MFILSTIVKPKKAGQTPKIYYVCPNHFTSNKNDAHKCENREEALEVQGCYDFDLQIEPV